MADFNVNHITGKQGQQGTVLAGVTTVSSTGSMRIPSGSSAYRGNGGRGITGSGWNPNSIRTIDYYQIASTGNATGWGDVIGYGAALAGSASNNTRGLTAGGFEGSPTNNRITTVQALTIPTIGDIFDFGDLSTTTQQAAGASNSTRAVYTSGNSVPLVLNKNYMIQFATSGSVQDFGDILDSSSCRQTATCQTPTRGYYAGGEGSGGVGSNPGSAWSKNITITTFSTLGSSDKFGELSTFRYQGSGVGSATRGVFIGGSTPVSSPEVYQNSMEYITLTTTGETTDFGDATSLFGASSHSGASNMVRGVVHNGRTADGGTALNTLEYITIATTGNTTDFGDLNYAAHSSFTVSDSHGGLDH